MPKCATETFELDVTRKELAVIFSDAERRDNSKVNPELGKTAFDVANIPNNEAVDLCNKALGSYGKSLDRIKNSPIEAVWAIGASLQHLRDKYKTEGSCR